MEFSEMTEKAIYTVVESHTKRKKIQSRTPNKKYEYAAEKKRLESPHKNAGFHSHSQPQIQASPQIDRIPEHDMNKEFRAASSGCIAAVILGIICFILLGISAFFATKYFQASCEYQNMLDNDTQEYENSMVNMKNKCFSKDQLNSEKYGEARKNKWSCCGEKCYYFSDRHKNFEESRKFCINLGSRLLKIEDKDEQEFIQSLVSYFYWIGLSRKGIISPWMWEDGSLMHYSLALQGSNVNNNNCVYTTATKVVAALCTKQVFFICEKNYTNFDLKLSEDK
ncbi:natural killer cells antigen CD94 isoform X1 [Equus caballus]|uniref:C-type lectin domain-containing protein n=2 Tax=Equus caballus TaxID=9796 RepID=A0A3Q2HX39_HORSE|nr:C-type lectin domain family 7 member A [Equus caballus]